MLDDTGHDDQEEQEELQVIAGLSLAVSGNHQNQQHRSHNNEAEAEQNIHIGTVQEEIIGGMRDRSARAVHLDILRPQPHIVPLKADMSVVEAVIQHPVHKPQESGRFRVEAGHQNHYSRENRSGQDDQPVDPLTEVGEDSSSGPAFLRLLRGSGPAFRRLLCGSDTAFCRFPCGSGPAFLRPPRCPHGSGSTSRVICGSSGRSPVCAELHDSEAENKEGKKQRRGARVAANPCENSQNSDRRNLSPADFSKPEPYIAKGHEEQMRAEIRRIEKAESHPRPVIVCLLVVGQILDPAGKRQGHRHKRDREGDRQMHRQNLPEFHAVREKK